MNGILPKTDSIYLLNLHGTIERQIGCIRCVFFFVNIDIGRHKIHLQAKTYRLNEVEHLFSFSWAWAWYSDLKEIIPKIIP